MIVLYVLKATGVLVVAATAELWADGQALVAAGALPMLASLWLATRLYARRRARRGDT